MKYSLLFLLLILSSLGCSNHTNGPEDKSQWQIIPSVSVGKITKNSTEEELYKIYGKENVKKDSVYIGEGFYEAGTLVFPGTPNELKIIWKNNYRNPAVIFVKGSGSSWYIVEGIRIGTSADEVKKINGKDFLLTGFDWDYPGRTFSWQQGKLPESLQLQFSPTEDIPSEEYETVMGDGLFSSDNSSMQRLQLKVEMIILRW